MLVNGPQGTIAMKRALHSALEGKARILPSLLIALTMSAAAGLSPPTHETERHVDELLARMTLQEKVGQLQQLHSVPDVWRVRDEHRDLIPRGLVGSFLNVPEPEISTKLSAGRRAIAAENPAAFWFRCDPRLSHHLPDSPGGGQ